MSAAPRTLKATERLAPIHRRFLTMATIGLRMMFHDRLKMLGTLFGVIFAVLLSNQQAGTFMGLIYKNIMFVENAGADVWVLPRGTESLQPGGVLSLSTLYAARGTPGVAWAEPLIYSNSVVQLPAGGVQAVTLVGTKGPRYAGGPWNVVRGDPKVLGAPDTMIFEDSERELLGGLNVGSVREVSGHRIVVGGFSWGLLPFGPSFSFADFELARELTHMASDQAHFLVVGVEKGQDPQVIAARIAAERPDVIVVTKAKFSSMIIGYLLFKTPIGVTFGSSTIFALIVGFVIVSLSMFSSVLDNVREFGTLKAVGATLWDLTVLLVVQAVTYAVIGTIIGLSFVTFVANSIRSPKLGIQLPWQLLAGTTLVMIVICVLASSLALLRLRKVEPAMVFR